jgi:DnaK suppressor protein
MKPNLSFQAFATTLAAIGVSGVIAACGGSSPTQAKDPVSSSETAAPTKPAAAGHASCSAAGCGANKSAESAKHDDAAKKGGQASCSAAGCGANKAAAGGDAAKKDAPSTSAAATTATETKPEMKPAASSSSTTPPAATPAKAAAPAPALAPAKKAGGASCGAGTCAAKK